MKIEDKLIIFVIGFICVAALYATDMALLILELMLITGLALGFKYMKIKRR